MYVAKWKNNHAWFAWQLSKHNDVERVRESMRSVCCTREEDGDGGEELESYQLLLAAVHQFLITNK